MYTHHSIASILLATADDIFSALEFPHSLLGEWAKVTSIVAYGEKALLNKKTLELGNFGMSEG